MTKRPNFVSDPLGNQGVILERGSEASPLFIIKRANVPTKEPKLEHTPRSVEEPKINVPKDEEIFRQVKFLTSRDFK